MDTAAMYRRSRHFPCLIWRQLRAIDGLRFPNAAQERSFVQHAGEHGLSVMRYAHRFLLSANEDQANRDWPLNQGVTRRLCQRCYRQAQCDAACSGIAWHTSILRRAGCIASSMPPSSFCQPKRHMGDTALSGWLLSSAQHPAGQVLCSCLPWPPRSLRQGSWRAIMNVSRQAANLSKGASAVM